MTPAYYQELFQHMRWANHRMWGCVMQLSDEQYVQPLEYSIGSIQRQTVHTMGVEYWWPEYLRGGETKFLRVKEFPDRAAVRARWDEIEAANLAYVAALTMDDLQREIMPPFGPDDRKPLRVWQVLTQVVMHSHDHRAQIMAMLHGFGVVGVEQDYIGYLFEQMLTQG